ncbi:ATP-dependent DNA helicase [Heracleum sosnowskyi]|uniref:ATP-dependent DNA helicase n=1 Tax=Heracleum sosnowskyi TaxID=360622 RepID=A0AAD8MBA4_9APIA|nr:ATP-dependent DNA helicase [Heracleum sosnowskyi]
MRLEEHAPPITLNGKSMNFRDRILRLGDGTEPTYALDDDIEPTWIPIPKKMQVEYSGDPVKAIVDEIYGTLQLNHGNIEYLLYTSCDSICKASVTSSADEVLYPTEYLNSLRFSGLPNHELKVKEGVTIMLLRNLNPKKGLCNGTRLIVTRCYKFLIEGLIITGNKMGEKAYIPRISMTLTDKALPFVLKRKQFHVAMYYAMTINKSQGQTVKNVGLFLPKTVFSHGQVYVVVSRVTSPLGLKILCVDEAVQCAGYTKNVVYREIFNDLA